MIRIVYGTKSLVPSARIAYIETQNWDVLQVICTHGSGNYSGVLSWDVSCLWIAAEKINPTFSSKRLVAAT